MKSLAAALLVLCVSACTWFQDTQPEPQLGSLANRIKTHLINEQPLDAAAIQVREVGQTIVLDGFAESQAKKQQLESLARAVAGERKIVNQIQIR